MRLLLDTTYLLPAIGIVIKGIPKDAAISLTQKGHQICISDISIFELSAKGAKHIAEEALSPERVARGIRAIVHDEELEKITIYEDTILLTAFKLRNMLSDFIDCLILSSAMNRCDFLVTEDSKIQNLKEDKEFNEMLGNINPKFRIQRLADSL
ncbi:MAG: hypothetical protein HY619_05170 [Thaumarchaeota archaeon]|nr:hypothetical protein [Nitrososphaerota archaeon]